MLRNLRSIVLVFWCLFGADAVPVPRSTSSRQAPRERMSPSTDHEPTFDEDSLFRRVAPLDQTAQASSIVDDFAPRQRLPIGRMPYPDPYSYRTSVRYPKLAENEVRSNKRNKDCYNCYRGRHGIVALGESRSYSIVTNPQTAAPTEAPIHTQGNQVYTEPLTNWVTSQPEETTEVPTTELAEQAQEKIISVRISSSVGKAVHHTEPAALLTQDQPYATAVQRSQFSVDEAVHEPMTTQTVHDLFDSKRIAPSSIPFTSSTLNIESSTASNIFQGIHPTPSYGRTDRSLFYTNAKSGDEKDYIQQQDIRLQKQTTSAITTGSQNVVVIENSSPVVNPLSYHTSVKSATSGSRVSFYREPPTLRVSSTTPSVEPETERHHHETRVETVSYHEEVGLPPRLGNENQTINEEKSYQFTNVHDQSFHHVQVTHLEPKEKKRQSSYISDSRYSQPEQNYEVDESLSLKTNGRAHGVQGGPNNRPDNNKFGYVVEGRDFRKYRVEERTADGFIVGEYGVVRHDDGSLRGVRYTADSTINPKVIYEALVKFLSL